ncbi:MAG: class I SAM-dependent methyltransferase [Acidobacteria bacterium]|nr:MAG: class I SAM-dependent methyltransferase [Acidobacteriota bacterium]REK01730.1 MAG: class I SAM-dependent methyltransferase [Acidobacteriota bacterium]REK14686.1 MAG: class I SAM-dependent methyltransferase [Acidobacteriota bacterium]REK45401.1 MAG: class I SAM-dependent methyltransferase [Acidobacteriota bacterium]
MSKAFDLLKWGLTLGKDEQNFLGARWVPAFLRRVPERSKRKWALRVLDLSPHYFLFPNNPKYKGLSKDEYLEAIADDARISREKIRDSFLLSKLEDVGSLIDWGCGPGFMAKALSPHLKKITAVDISAGALACAEIINGADNIRYIVGDRKGLSTIKDGSADAVISFHLFQHLSDKIARIVLSNASSKLRSGGKLIVHVQTENDIWRTEEEWRSDESLKGRMKLRYGLNCFGRSQVDYQQMLGEAGFEVESFEDMSDLMRENSTELDGQVIVTAYKY